MQIAFNQRTLEHIGRSMEKRWVRWRHTVFFTLLVGILIGGGVFWYWSSYVFHWTDEQKTAYMNQKFQTIQFQRSRFDKMIKMLDRRRSDFEAVSKDGRDIFQP